MLAAGAYIPAVGRAWLYSDQCPNPGGDSWLFGLLLFGVAGALSTALSLMNRWRMLRAYHNRIKAIEDDLPERLRDGSLRLLKVTWLLERPSDWVLQRQQDLPPEAFWTPAKAVHLLLCGKVAALSYKWQGPFNSSKGGGDQPDGSRFHLEAVLKYYREGNNAKQRPALMWDFCALPQHDPITGEKRTAAENDVFKAGLGVMTNAYSSPRVLVLQHRRIPEQLERELYSGHGGQPPADRPDLIPYAGKYCRSGWCTSESACALLMTAGGGHAYELGVGRAPAARGWMPSLQEMEALFEHESTIFLGKADREVVSNAYLDLRRKLERYDEECVPPLVRLADDLLTGTFDSQMIRLGFGLCLLLPSTWAILTILVAWSVLQGKPAFDACRSSWAASMICRISMFVVWPSVWIALGILSMVSAAFAWMLLFLAIAAWAFLFYSLPSRILRAHLAVALGYRTRHSLEYTFHCSLIKPPFRKRTTSVTAESMAEEDRGGAPVVADCFLPHVGKSHWRTLKSRMGRSAAQVAPFEPKS